jgi:hypothetical protein
VPNPKGSSVSFSQGDIAPWSPNSTGTFAAPPVQAGGRLHFPLVNSGAAGLGNNSAIDLTGNWDYSSDRNGIIWASLASGLHTRTTWSLSTYNGRDLEFQLLDGVLTCQCYVGGYTVLRTLPFDPVQHACWQIRNDGTTSFFDVGPVPTALVTVASTAALSASDLGDVTDATISVAITATGGAIVGETAIAGYNALNAMPGWLSGPHDPMLDLILASVRRTYSTS